MSGTPQWVARACVLGLAMLLATVTLIVPLGASGQTTNTGLQVDFDSVVTTPAELRAPIEAALTDAASLFLDGGLSVTALRTREPQGDWAYAVVLPSNLLGERIEETSAASFTALLGQRDDTGNWRFAVDGTATFAQLMAAVPGDFVEAGPELLAPQGAELDQALDFLFPWTSGHRWYKTQGWHGGAPWANALDLQPSARGLNIDLARDFAVLAAERGRLDVNCNDGTTITLVVVHPNGQGTLYAHLDARAYRADLVGKQIQRGQYLGYLYRTGNTNNGVGGFYSTRCGYGTAAHLHFALPTRAMMINGYAADSVSSAPGTPLYTSSNQRVENPAPPIEGITVDDDSPNMERSGPASTFYPVSPGQNGSVVFGTGAVWTGSSTTPPVGNMVKWKPPLDRCGNWEIFAYIPRIVNTLSDTASANYQIRYRGDGIAAVSAKTVVVNQDSLTNQFGPSSPNRWYSLGTFPFSLSAGAVGEYVALGDVTGETRKTSVNFDAMRWVFRGENAAACLPDQPPTGAYLEPANGTTVSGPVWLRATATDERGVARVRFTATYKDKPWYIVFEDIAPPYEYLWDMAGVPDGGITIGVDIQDSSGQWALSPQGTRTITKQATVPPQRIRIFLPLLQR